MFHQQDSMTAACLPLELQQLVFSLLDSKSFYSARNVCRYWRTASIDAVILEKQLKKLPISPPVDAKVHGPGAIYKLYIEATRTLMLGLKIDRKHDSPGTLADPYRHGLQATPHVCPSPSGKHTITLNDENISLFDSASFPAKLIRRIPLNAAKLKGGQDLPSLTRSRDCLQLALSSGGELLAVARAHSIRIYDLTNELNHVTVDGDIQHSTGNVICGLSFEQNDHILRVRLSDKGAVIYLGTTEAGDLPSQPANIVHWKSDAGLRNCLLDSSTLIPSNTEPVSQSTRLSGLQILQPFRDGVIFAAQRHGADENSHYILGHVKFSSAHSSRCRMVDPRTLTVLARLESFLSSWDYTLNCKNSDGSMGLWEDMPSAHEHHPDYCLSSDGSLLALAERGKKRVRPIPLSQVFLYRVPDNKAWERILRQTEQQKQREQGMCGKRLTVGRIPRCLTTVQGLVTDMRFEEEEQNGLLSRSLRLATADTTRRWEFSEL